MAVFRQQRKDHPHGSRSPREGEIRSVQMLSPQIALQLEVDT